MELGENIRYYRSFIFWARKSFWLLLGAVSGWVVWQIITLDLFEDTESIIIDNAVLRGIFIIVLIVLFMICVRNFFVSWKPDAWYEEVKEIKEVKESDEAEFDAIPSLPETEVTIRPAAELPEVKDVRTIKPPPPFGVTDDLTLIEGIGPKIQETLQKADIKTFAKLAETTPEQLKDILTRDGDKYNFHNPASWPGQAALANVGKWDELKELQKNIQ